ncbi:hypothetical protein G7Y89_g6195 [Cudoniella acicularis]|uniref:DUF1279 domain-containing protein n=1 Tax=Cudoniella acicularis TaxID=354080 RepID=A0A8H4RKY5_9HELO|nr:hypothetical protein G7Y89_g6195 [Cudoniella acicularis]
MLRNTISSAGARGVQAMRPTFRASNFSTTARSLARRPITATRPSPKAKTNPTTRFIFSSHNRTSPFQNQSMLQRLRSSMRSFHNTRARRNGTTSGTTESEPQSISARLRKLSREYGWSAVGIYFMLSALDFPFCYLLVRYLGTERIGEWEHLLVSNIKRLIPESVKQTWHDWRSSMKQAEREVTVGGQINDKVEMAGWGVEEADARNKMNASLATQLALAYAIHKSFIFVRVPLTAAVTPKVVKVLRGWGWDIGKRTTKEARAVNRAARATRARVPKAKRP